MNTARKGNAAEVKVGKQLEADGWVVGSRRHIGGAGDLLAVSTITRRSMLVEVKTTSRGPWADFGPADRKAMSGAASSIGARAYLVWWPTTHEQPEWIAEELWPR